MLKGGIDNKFALREPEYNESEPVFYTYVILANWKMYNLKTTAPNDVVSESIRFYNGIKHYEISDFVELLIDEGYQANLELIAKANFTIGG